MACARAEDTGCGVHPCQERRDTVRAPCASRQASQH
ncbi:hypothetical protein ID866_12542 [Astraeus odoratus]|nr:hypothetical protein ID866_12542 [Astraeus odoratus]